MAPDYIYCDRAIKDKLVKEIKRQIQKQYGKEPLTRENYGKIINEKHFDRISGLIDQSKVVFGGNTNRRTLQIEPTVMDNVTFGDAMMQEEIFGPLMPILIYDTLDEAIRNINSMPHPLALYIFTSDKAAAKKVTSRCGFGGGCINDTIFILQPARWDSADSAKAEWDHIMDEMDLIRSLIIRVLWIKRHGWIFRCGISHTRR